MSVKLLLLKRTTVLVRSLHAQTTFRTKWRKCGRDNENGLDLDGRRMQPEYPDKTPDGHPWEQMLQSVTFLYSEIRSSLHRPSTLWPYLLPLPPVPHPTFSFGSATRSKLHLPTSVPLVCPHRTSSGATWGRGKGKHARTCHADSTGGCHGHDRRFARENRCAASLNILILRWQFDIVVPLLIMQKLTDLGYVYYCQHACLDVALGVMLQCGQQSHHLGVNVLRGLRCHWQRRVR